MIFVYLSGAMDLRYLFMLMPQRPFCKERIPTRWCVDHIFLAKLRYIAAAGFSKCAIIANSIGKTHTEEEKIYRLQMICFVHLW